MLSGSSSSKEAVPLGGGLDRWPGGLPAAVHQLPAEEVAAHLSVHAQAEGFPDGLLQRVGGLVELTHVEHHVVALEETVGRLEDFEAAQVEDLDIPVEAEAVIFGIGRVVGPALLVSPSLLENEFERFPVAAHAHLPLFCHDDVVLQGALVLVDDDVGDAVPLLLLVADLDGEAGQFRVEDAFADVEGRLGDADVVEHRREPELCHGDHPVGDGEGQDAHGQAEQDEGPHEPEQGDARRPDGHEFEALAQVAEGHDGG
jgi:hypothetical protein